MTTPPAAIAVAITVALRRLPQTLLMGVVKGYRLLLKPWLGNACRFEPTCSAYTLQALQQHGAAGGSALGTMRLLRCHPWCAGGLDPVPEDLRAGLVQHLPTRLFTHLLREPPGDARDAAATPAPRPDSTA